MKHCWEADTADSVAAFRSCSQTPPWGDTLVSNTKLRN